jgi:2-keto-4-pentenoate hydratase
MESATQTKAVALLANAYRTGKPVVELPGPCGPGTEAEAYSIQDALIGHCGWRPWGWKVGATNGAAQRLLGLPGPFSGRLLEHSCHADGARVPLAGGRPALVEAEIAFRLGADLTPGQAPFTCERVAAAVAVAMPAIEVVYPRFVDWLAVGGLQIIADNGAHGCFVSGAETAAWDSAGMADLAVTLSINGATAAEGTPHNVLGHPLASLVWQADHAAARGRTLRKGEVITTGSCVPLTWAEPGDRVSADFGSLGTVSAILGSRAHQD